MPGYSPDNAPKPSRQAADHAPPPAQNDDAHAVARAQQIMGDGERGLTTHVQVARYHGGGIAFEGVQPFSDATFHAELQGPAHNRRCLLDVSSVETGDWHFRGVEAISSEASATVDERAWRALELFADQGPLALVSVMTRGVNGITSSESGANLPPDFALGTRPLFVRDLPEGSVVQLFQTETGGGIVISPWNTHCGDRLLYAVPRARSPESRQALISAFGSADTGELLRGIFFDLTGTNEILRQDAVGRLIALPRLAAGRVCAYAGARHELAQQLYRDYGQEMLARGVSWLKELPTYTTVADVREVLQFGLERELLQRGQGTRGNDTLELRLGKSCESAHNQAIMTIADMRLHIRFPAAASEQEWHERFGCLLTLFADSPPLVPAQFGRWIDWSDSVVPDQSWLRGPQLVEAYRRVLALRLADEISARDCYTAQLGHAYTSSYDSGFWVIFSRAIWGAERAAINLGFRVNSRGIERIELTRSPERGAHDVRMFAAGDVDLKQLFKLHIEDKLRLLPFGALADSDVYDYLRRTSDEMSTARRLWCGLADVARAGLSAFVRFIRD